MLEQGGGKTARRRAGRRKGREVEKSRRRGGRRRGECAAGSRGSMRSLVGKATAGAGRRRLARPLSCEGRGEDAISQPRARGVEGAEACPGRSIPLNLPLGRRCST